MTLSKALRLVALLTTLAFIYAADSPPVVHDLFRATSAIGQCATLTPSPSLVCSYAIDYPFFLPAGYAATDLDTLAKSKLDDSRLSIAPVGCQIALKKLVCSNIFLKCQPGVDLTELSPYSTWNFGIYSDLVPVPIPSPGVPVPFQRPCKDVCDNANSQCFGLLKLFGLDQDCTATRDYSSGLIPVKPYQYDSTNNPAVCNSMTATFEVASAAEPYLGATKNGACAGIITTLFVPPGPAISPSLSPFQPPGVVQTLIDQQLLKSFQQLPPWLSSDCHLALRKYFCGSYMLYPQAQAMADVFASLPIPGGPSNLAAALTAAGINAQALTAYTFYLPSYPHQQVCQDYSSKCAAFLQLANSPALTPQCSANTSSTSGVMKFPTRSQNLLTVPLSLLGTSLNVPLSTSPNIMSQTNDAGYSTNCPPGFVVPETPSDPMLTWIPGSGCTLPCKTNMFSAEEWKGTFLITKTMSSLGFPMITLMLFVWCLDKQKRKQYLIIWFAVFSFILSISFVIIAGMNDSGNDTYCKDNASRFNQKTGPSTCTIQGAINTFCALAACASWLAQAADLFFKVVLNMNTSSYYWIGGYLFFVLSVPFTSTVYMAGKGILGYGGNLPWCFIGDYAEKDVDAASFYIPILIMSFLGVCFMSGVVGQVCLTIRRGAAMSGDGSTKKAQLEKIYANLKLVRTPIIYVILFLIVWVSFFTFRGTQYTSTPKIVEAAKTWYACIFKNYDGSDSWKGVCGIVLSERIEVSFVQWTVLVATGQSVFVSLIFLPSITFPSDVRWLLSKWGLMSAVPTKRTSIASTGGGGFGSNSSKSNSAKVACDDDKSSRRVNSTRELSTREFTTKTRENVENDGVVEEFQGHSEDRLDNVELGNQGIEVFKKEEDMEVEEF